jgi:hypothetical protein
MKEENKRKVLENLDKLYEHYYDDGAVKTSEIIAKKVSACDKEKEWGWRYMRSLMSGSLEPRKRVSRAINKAAKKIAPKKERPDYRLRPVQVLCTGEEYKKIINAMGTEERAKKLLDYGKAPFTATTHATMPTIINRTKSGNKCCFVHSHASFFFLSSCATCFSSIS